ncbi:MAG: hypothetical protein HC871_02230 [Rhizobiales bacterium]|nr:hypothetical protein [Hyphomicrobiales bacterium]
MTGLRRLHADVALQPRGAGIALTATWAAEVVQDCVVTLDPVVSELGDTFELAYGPAAEAEPAAEIELELDVADPPEPIEGGRIDEGAADMTYRLTLSAPLEQPFYLAYSTLDGSARAGEDYEAAREVLIIPAGEQQAEFSIALIDDGEAEEEETFTLSVGASNRSVAIDRSRLESVIVDNDR